MSYLRRIISLAGTASASRAAAPATGPLTVGRLIRRRGALIARRAAADLAAAAGEESNESLSEAGVIPAALADSAGPPSVRRETAAQSSVTEPEGIAGNGRALQVGPGKQEVSRVGYERIESSIPLRADQSVSNPDAKDWSVQGSVRDPSGSPRHRPASVSPLPAAPLAAGAAVQSSAAQGAGSTPGAPAAAIAPLSHALLSHLHAETGGPAPSGYAEAELSLRPEPQAGVPSYRVAATVHDAVPPAGDAREHDAPRSAGGSRQPGARQEAQPAHAAESAAAEPTVHIGSIEVIVEAAPEPAPRAAPAAAGADLSSRFYLRGL